MDGVICEKNTTQLCVSKNKNNLKPLYRNIYGKNQEDQLARGERIAKANKKRILHICIIAIFTLECMVGIGAIMYFVLMMQ